MSRHILIVCALLSLSTKQAKAQEFFNLTAQEVKIDSVLPVFTHQYNLGSSYKDSVYEVSIEYPEFIDMTPTDIARYQLISNEPLPEWPVVRQHLSLERKQGILGVSFMPLVMRNGRYQKLVAFKLNKRAIASAPRRVKKTFNADGDRYAAHSVLASGTWVKIRVPETGIYQLDEALIKRAGFNNLAKVKVYGYGGALQPESLTGNYLTETDDLKEVPTCEIGGKRVFHAQGPVSWTSNESSFRTRNFYSTHGYYFLTESESEPIIQDSLTFVSGFYPSPNDYHSLSETDDYAWFHSGRNLYDSKELSTTTAATYTLEANGNSGTLSVAMTYNGYCEAQVMLNDSVVGTVLVNETTRQQGVSYFTSSTYSSVAAYTWHFDVTNKLKPGENTVRLLKTSGPGTMRTDYVMLTFNEPKPLPYFSSSSLPKPEIVGTITPQDHHADPNVDMVIIIPTTQHLLEQAKRLKAIHEEHDKLSVTIVPADELYNEFSSGTPDGNAYRRYLKMMYDRATNESQLPRYLLLMGDGAWDNRMLCSHWQSTTPDDFLLCYESENSFSATYSYVSDDFYCMLDDEELISDYQGKPDLAVGRISARNADQAKIITDKIISYINNENAGSWQNIICVMGDDGNSSQHMDDAETMANEALACDSAFNVKRIYWDAYTRVASATGNRYPEVERLVKQQMRDGALIMNYSGHGAAYSISHEQVLQLKDFKNANSQGRLPMWVTASCDIAPFDSQEDNIGESAVFNQNGGAIAFLGTARTVFMTQNRQINRAFMKHVLETTDQGLNTIGEALRLAKNDLVEAGSDLSSNKLHYTLLGDPALKLAVPQLRIVIDSLDGKAIGSTPIQLNAGTQTSIVGHIEGQPGFNGTITATILDVEENILCKLNEPDAKAIDEVPYRFKNRSSVLYQGSDSIANGKIKMNFAIPKDISYSSETGQIIVYAISNDKTMAAHGENKKLTIGGGENLTQDGIGPSIYCYLNDESFQNGGTVNATPYFYAVLSDNDGINASGSGIGHDMELIIDGELMRTYNLNGYFQYDFGDYRSGTVGYSIPELSAGKHKLLFRVWDVLNNSSTAELSFVVDPKQDPAIVNVVCTKNPANSFTRFLISHNRAGSEMDIQLEIFDTSGRVLWQRNETGVPADKTYTLDWDLSVSNGSRLKTGVYLYRVSISSGGSQWSSMARKLIITGR